MATKPTLLIVPASFSPPDLYNIAVPKLNALGYEVLIVATPSVGRKEVAPTMLDDAAAIHTQLEQLTDQGKDIVLIAHSYGGIPTSESVKGYSKEARTKAGNKGGVIRILYTTCLVTREGQSASDLLGNAPPLDFIKIDGDWMSLEPEGHAPTTFSDLPHEEGVEWTKRMSEQSAPSFGTKLTYGGYKDVPVSYLLCENDVVIPPELQQSIIAMIEEESGNKVDVHKIKSDHAPWISHTDSVVEVIRQITA